MTEQWRDTPSHRYQSCADSKIVVWKTGQQYAPGRPTPGRELLQLRHRWHRTSKQMVLLVWDAHSRTKAFLRSFAFLPLIGMNRVKQVTALIRTKMPSFPSVDDRALKPKRSPYTRLIFFFDTGSLKPRNFLGSNLCFLRGDATLYESSRISFQINPHVMTSQPKDGSGYTLVRQANIRIVNQLQQS